MHGELNTIMIAHDKVVGTGSRTFDDHRGVPQTFLHFLANVLKYRFEAGTRLSMTGPCTAGVRSIYEPFHETRPRDK